MGDHKKNWQQKLHEVIYEADTPMGKVFDIILMIFILISIALVMLESVPSLDKQYHQFFYISEWVVTIIFSVEYLFRIISIQRPRKYIFSFYGVIDFLSTIPMYLTLIFTGVHALLAVRALRLLRVFRILKVTRYIGEADKLSKAIRQSGPKIAVFMFAVVVLSIILGTVMYLVEGPANGFTSIPRSIYWCIVTLTTVGFGDITPSTPLGQFIAAIVMILGYGIIAVPTGIISAEYSQSGSEEKNKKGQKPSNNPNYRHVNTQVCQRCLAEKHQDDALFCHQCGHDLHD